MGGYMDWLELHDWWRDVDVDVVVKVEGRYAVVKIAKRDDREVTLCLNREQLKALVKALMNAVESLGW